MSDSQIVLYEVCQVIRMQPFRRGRTLISILGFLIGMILVLASDGVCIARLRIEEKHEGRFCHPDEGFAFWYHPKVLPVFSNHVAGFATVVDVGDASDAAAV